MPQPLSRSLPENLAYLQKSFGASGDFYAKELAISGIRCAIVMFTGRKNSATWRWKCWTATPSCWAAAKGCATTF